MTAPSDQFQLFILDIIDLDVVIGRFFGGRKLEYNGVQFAILMGNTLYLRIAESDHEKFESYGSTPFSYATKRRRVVVKKYYSVPEAWLDDPELLRHWVQETLSSSEN
ncbi:MAG: TfoX/Sxy family protein [Pseudomonadales bacterium]|nr:TfoX/Sxy family protein [Pseudomonadales bacterium]